MKVLILGGAGFLGQELCKSLIRPDSPGLKRRGGSVEAVDQIVLFDMPGSFDALKAAPFLQDPRVRIETGRIEYPATLVRLVDTPGMSVFHLAGIMSGQGEKDFDLCMRVNLDGCRNVLEACRAKQAKNNHLVRLVFAASCASFGETTDFPMKDHTKQVPLNTYGMTKSVGEMLVNDYTRKGFLDGCSARLPTVIVRPGAPNAASTGCYSGVAREPLKGMDVALPVGRHLLHAVSSTRTIIANLRALHDADMGAVGQAPVDRAVSLPSTPVTLQVLIDALHRVVPEGQRSKLGKITDAVDPFLNSVVGSMAMKSVDSSRALALGLQEVPDVDTIIREYIDDFSSDCVVSMSPAVGDVENPAKRSRQTTVKVAVITGAGGGIGRACAVALAKGGFSGIVLVGRRQEALEETAALVVKESTNAQVMSRSCDVTQAPEVQSLFLDIERRFGRCDLLFNNAGIGHPPMPLEDVSVSDFQRTLDINVTGTFLCTQEAFKLMKKQNPQGGRIINNGSVSADRPRPLSAAYTASKHAVTGLTKSTALDGRAYGIACGQIDIGNAVTDMSGYIGKGALQATPDGSERRLVEPMMDVANVAKTVEYMASLPQEANVLFLTVMATNMPLVGRG
jgi:NAD(P)-dependent dehydrogenase (short-subunit alcohol dehydrogenase family)